MKSKNAAPASDQREGRGPRRPLRQDRHLGGRRRAALSERRQEPRLCAGRAPRRANGASSWRPPDSILAADRILHGRRPAQQPGGSRVVVRRARATSKRLARLRSSMGHHCRSGPVGGPGCHSSGRRAEGFMLSVYVPQGACLERREVPPDGELPENAVWFDLVNPTHRRRQADRAPARHRGPDPRGDAGDRGHQPALCRERRALHDRDADVPVRHRTRRRPRRSPSSWPAIGWSPCATTSRKPFTIVGNKLCRSCPPTRPAKPC